MRKFTPRTVYYSAHVLKDGTVWLAVPTRKPSRTKRPSVEIDAEGIHQRFEYSDAPTNLGDSGRMVWNIAVANSLNMKRIVREQVESKLNDLLERHSDVQQRLAELESRWDEFQREERCTRRFRPASSPRPRPDGTKSSIPSAVTLNESRTLSTIPIPSILEAILAHWLSHEPT